MTLGTVYLFGVVIMIMIALIAGLLSLPLALSISYVPYLGYALFRKRPRVRILRHFFVFALIWCGLLVVGTIVMFAGSTFSAAGGPIEVFGVGLFHPALLVAPAVWFLVILVTGELSVFLLRRSLPTSDEETSVPVEGAAGTLRAGAVALIAMTLALAGYIGTIVFFAVLAR